LVSDEIYNYAQSREKSKVKFILCAETMKVLIWLDLNKMENLINSKRCYCLHLNEKKIVKGGQHNEKLWRDGFVKPSNGSNFKIYQHTNGTNHQDIRHNFNIHLVFQENQ
jgi:hypothetical protein